MAFTTRSKKLVDPTLPPAGSTPDELGPGYYALDDTFTTRPEGFAPFSSLRERNDEGIPPTKAPPVGSYDTDLPWGGHGPGITQTGLPCKFVPFSSTADRFNGPGSAFGSVKSTEQPGPGEYRAASFTRDLGPKRRHRTIGVPDRTPSELRALSAPSIPVGDQCWGYSEGARGLVRHLGPRRYLGTKRDSIGPDIYNPSLRSTKIAPGGTGRTFGKSTRSEKAKASAAPGPGQYKLKGFGIDPVRRSAAFMSASERSSGGPKGLALERIKAEPDPGTYNPKVKAINVKNTRAELQFFHSTAERFPSQSLRNDEVKAAPGPGQYVIAAPDVNVPDFRKMKGERFGGHGDFTEPWRSCCESPGPGTYEMELQVDEENGYGESMKGAMPIHSFSVLSHSGQAAFGSTTRRFVPKKVQDEMPGPTAYEVENRGNTTMDDTYAKKVRTSLPDNAFESKFDRLRAVKHRDVKPDPTAYDPRPPAANIPRVKPPAEGFTSQAARFKYVDEYPGPGPGQYAVTSYQALGDTPSINRGVGAGLGFAASEKREDMSIRMQEKNAVPGPGSYDVAGEWVQKSHNQLFNPELLSVTQ